MGAVENIMETIRRLERDVTAPMGWRQSLIRLLQGCIAELQRKDAELQRKDAELSELTKLYSEAVDALKLALARLKEDETQYENLEQLIGWARQVQQLFDEDRLLILPWPRAQMATMRFHGDMIVNEDIYGRVEISARAGGDDGEQEADAGGNAGNAVELGPGAGHDSGV